MGQLLWPIQLHFRFRIQCHLPTTVWDVVVTIFAFVIFELEFAKATTLVLSHNMSGFLWTLFSQKVKCLPFLKLTPKPRQMQRIFTRTEQLLSLAGVLVSSSRKMNTINDTQTLERVKSAKETDIFVIICGICRGVQKSKYPKSKTGIKTMQELHINKACNVCTM